MRALGWGRRVGFEDGLAATVEWYRSERDWWTEKKSGGYSAYYDLQYGARLRAAGQGPER